MKRIIPLILVFVITLTCMVSPVSASSFEMPESYFDVLQYATPNGFSGTSFSLPDTYGTVSFDLPGKTLFNYVDILVSSTSVIEAFSISSDDSIQVLQLGSGMYRICGSITPQYYDPIDISFETKAASYITFYSFHAFNTYINPEPLVGDMELYIVDDMIYSAVMPEPSYSLGYAPPVESSAFTQEVTVNLACGGYKEYDYICFRFRTRLNVKSIMAFSEDGTISLPVNTTYANDFAISQDGLYFTCLVDVRNLAGKDFYLQVRCNRQANLSGVFTFFDVTGYLDTSYVDPVLYFLRKFASNVEDWFGEVIDAVTGNSSSEEADSFNESITDQSQELEDMTNIMGSVEKPDINNINFNPSTMVDSNTLVLATSGLSNVLGNQIIIRILLMALTFALVGFILYGKK